MSTSIADDSTMNDYEEPENAALRQQLGLRPIHYWDQQTKGSHPDQHPCPPWCWIDNNPDYEHDIELDHPTTATHSISAQPAIVASQYGGDYYDQDRAGSSARCVLPATIEASMEQQGAGSPRISLFLRHTPGRDDHRFDKVLDLGLTDAEELATVLQYLVKVAKA